MTSLADRLPHLSDDFRPYVVAYIERCRAEGRDPLIVTQADGTTHVADLAAGSVNTYDPNPVRYSVWRKLFNSCGRWDLWTDLQALFRR